MSTKSIPRLKPAPKPSEAPPGVPLADLTITCLETDGHYYGKEDPHPIEGTHVARLLALVEAWAPGWNTLFDHEMAMESLTSTLEVGQTAMRILEDEQANPNTLYEFFGVLQFLRARVATTEAVVSREALSARYVVAPASANPEATR